MNVSVGDILTSPRNPDQQSPRLDFSPNFKGNESDGESDNLIALSKRRGELMVNRKKMIDRIDAVKKDIKKLQATKMDHLHKRNLSMSASEKLVEIDERDGKGGKNDTSAFLLEFSRLPSQDWDKRLHLLSKFCSTLNVVDAGTFSHEKLELHFSIKIEAVGNFVIHLQIDQSTEALTQFDITSSDVSSELAHLLSKTEALGPSLVIYSLDSFSRIRYDRARAWQHLWTKYGSRVDSATGSEIEQRFSLENSKILKLQRESQDFVVIWSITWDWDTFTGDCDSHFTCVLADSENHQNLTNTLLNLIKVQGIIQGLETLIESVFPLFRI